MCIILSHGYPDLTVIGFASTNVVLSILPDQPVFDPITGLHYYPAGYEIFSEDNTVDNNTQQNLTEKNSNGCERGRWHDDPILGD